ncbi:MAG TPA: response regulator transcription factor [Acidimicrobiales bacterium]|nr:response regulator transcription factor [Acidimicrobiales bacterium]
MPEVLIASDEPSVREEIRSVLSGMDDVTVREVARGADVLPAVTEWEPDLAVLDLQIGNMGGMAVCLELRLEESGDRIDHIPVLMLLDRRADVFLARRSAAEGFLVKPLDPIRVRRAVTAVLGGGTYEDQAFLPPDSGVAGGGAGGAVVGIAG